jgi:hypothetical protein
MSLNQRPPTNNRHLIRWVAFLGPGSLSIDARLFGRKRLNIRVPACRVSPLQRGDRIPPGGEHALELHLG